MKNAPAVRKSLRHGVQRAASAKRISSLYAFQKCVHQGNYSHAAHNSGGVGGVNAACYARKSYILKLAVKNDHGPSFFPCPYRHVSQLSGIFFQDFKKSTPNPDQSLIILASNENRTFGSHLGNCPHIQREEELRKKPSVTAEDAAVRCQSCVHGRART